VNGNNIVAAGNVIIVNGRVVSVDGPVVCASGPNKVQARELASYAGIQLEAPAEVSYAAGSSPAQLSVSAPENILPLLKTTVEGEQLVIRLEGCISLDEPIMISASGPPLSSLCVSGSGRIGASGLSGDSLRVKVSGSGQVFASGQIGTVRVDVSGSGDVDLSGLKASELDASVAGSGSVHAHAFESARVDVSGSGSVRVEGNPPRRDVGRSGSGQVFFR
jgi:hypothetical protein